MFRKNETNIDSAALRMMPSVFLAFVVCAIANGQTEKGDGTTESIDGLVTDEVLIHRLLNDDVAESVILFKELELLDSQAKELADHFKDIRSRILKGQFRLALAQEQRSNGTIENEDPLGQVDIEQLKHEVDALPTQCFEKLGDVLLPHQLSRLKQILYQRNLQLTGFMYVFEIPECLSSELGLSGEEKEVLQAAISRQKAEYIEKSNELGTAAMVRINNDVPKNLAQHIENSIGPRSSIDQFHWMAGTLPLEAQEWTAKEWRRLELSRLYSLLVGEKSLLNPELEITEVQRDLVVAKMRALDSQERQLRQHDRPRWLQMHLMKLEGDERWKIISDELEEKVTNLREKGVDDVLNTVLMPFQAKLLRAYAKQIRLREQALYSDDFGVPLIFAKEIELPEKTIANLERVIHEERSKYHEELKDLRIAAWSAIVEALPQGKQKMLRNLIGDPYDLEHERVCRLNEKFLESDN